MAFKAGPYKPWQIDVSSLVTKAILQQMAYPLGEAPIVCVRIARQAGKNEISATIQYWFLHAFGHIAGDHTYVRSSLNWKPQVVASKLRLEKIYKTDRVLLPKVRRREGYIYQYGNARVVFMSSDTTSNVVGETASAMLDMDEAHKVDEAKFEEDFQPFTASTNAPTVLWGVAADKGDVLHKNMYRNVAKGMGEWNIQIKAQDIAALDAKYAKHYQRRCRDLGSDHPVIKTQYDLVDVDQFGTAFNGRHIESLFGKGDHSRARGPKGIWANPYVVGIDLAGEEETGEEFDPELKSSGQRDSTFIVIGRLILSESRHEWMPPLIQIIDAHWWTGKTYRTRNGVLGQEEAILAILNLWRPDDVVCDARGIGHPIAASIRDNYPYGSVECYQASRRSNSQDASDLYRYLNHGQLQWWINDGSETYKEVYRQFGWCNRRITGHDVAEGLGFEKPRTNQHIDSVVATNYMVRAARKTASGKMVFISERW